MHTYKISNKQEKVSAKTGKTYVSGTLTDETGTEYVGVNAFNGEFAGDTWRGDLEKNGNYWNLVSPKKANTFQGGAFKSAQIEKAMDKKAQSIHEAQDRSAWMWAKNNASTLMAAKPYEELLDPFMNPKDLSNAVIILATLIYNGEPTEPFTSPIRPSNELSGLDKVNQQAAEKLFSTGLTDAELKSMGEMEF